MHTVGNGSTLVGCWFNTGFEAKFSLANSVSKRLNFIYPFVVL